MKTKLVSLMAAVILFSINGFAQNLKDFQSVLNDCGMRVTIPEGFVEVKVLKNGDMDYDYAIKYPDKDFEVRYSIRPIKCKSYANENVKSEMESQRSFRNSSYETVLKTIILNLTGGVESAIQPFGQEAVKHEFNADWGAAAFVKLKSDFGKGFIYCMVVAIHKDDVADAYYFYLANSKEKFSEYMNPFFHSLKFE